MIYAQADNCIICHSDNALSLERKGKTVSLFVDENVFSKSAHGKLECSNCHENFDAENIPHKEGVNISAVNCAKCHSNVSVSFNQNVHKKIISNKKEIPNCTTCHGKHNIQKVKTIPNKSKTYCSKCHENKLIVNTFHKLNSSKRNDCNSCHKDFNSIKNKLSLTPHKNFECYDCHEFVANNFNEHLKKIPTSEKASCKNCHTEINEIYKTSIHSDAVQSGKTYSAKCWDCHGSHKLIFNTLKFETIKDSTKVKIEQEKACLTCHLNNKNVLEITTATKSFVDSYEKSIHGKSLLSGNNKAANCIDCHGSHGIKKENNYSSKVNKQNISKTCAKCHSEIEKNYSGSIHGIAVNKGINDAPTCTNCHGEHNILEHTDPNSPIAKVNISTQVCFPCHNSLRLTQKYELSSDRFKSFSDSYHGLAGRSGSIEVANCASCHGVHNIKSSTDSTSTIHKNNLSKTCGKCHPGANERFAIGSVHVTVTQKDAPIIYWIKQIYIYLIITVIGAMFIHNLFDFIKKSKRKLLIRRGEIVEEKYLKHRLYLRMTLNERLQHGSLALSFIMLVVTGFMLHYPDESWVKFIRGLNNSVFDFRSFIHRTAGVVMILAGLYHTYYILFTDRGKQLIKDLMPKFQDLIDAISILKYNFGIVKEKPKFGRFSYIEKSEYWALIWGSIVMTLTGIIMWFDNTFIGLFTKLGWDVANTIHFYEAWLATLAIIVWHFYFVIFNPDVYPMNLAWIKGTISEEEMIEDHPMELKEIKKKESES